MRSPCLVTAILTSSVVAVRNNHKTAAPTGFKEVDVTYGYDARSALYLWSCDIRVNHSICARINVGALPIACAHCACMVDRDASSMNMYSLQVGTMYQCRRIADRLRALRLHGGLRHLFMYRLRIGTMYQCRRIADRLRALRLHGGP